MQGCHIELSFVAIFSKYDCATKTFRLKLRKLRVKSSKKGCVFNWGCFPSFLTRNFFLKMVTKDEVRPQVGTRLQLDVLQYSEIKVKEIKTKKHFFNVHLRL